MTRKLLLALAVLAIALTPCIGIKVAEALWRGIPRWRVWRGRVWRSRFWRLRSRFWIRPRLLWRLRPWVLSRLWFLRWVWRVLSGRLRVWLLPLLLLLLLSARGRYPSAVLCTDRSPPPSGRASILKFFLHSLADAITREPMLLAADFVSCLIGTDSCRGAQDELR
jgi:hypothetical protein